MAAEQRAQITWEGDLANGSGTFTVGSGSIGPQDVSWSARTEEPGGKTSPEELLAAAHASCFSMALSAGLARQARRHGGSRPRRWSTFDKVGDG